MSAPLVTAALTKIFKYSEITVNDGIYERIGQIVGPHTANFPLATTNSVTDRIK